MEKAYRLIWTSNDPRKSGGYRKGDIYGMSVDQLKSKLPVGLAVGSKVYGDIYYKSRKIWTFDPIRYTWVDLYTRGF